MHAGKVCVGGIEKLDAATRIDKRKKKKKRVWSL